jgi:hypothetical protein
MTSAAEADIRLVLGFNVGSMDIVQKTPLDATSLRYKYVSSKNPLLLYTHSVLNSELNFLQNGPFSNGNNCPSNQDCGNFVRQIDTQYRRI